MNKDLKDYIIQMRRYFHMYPEVSLNEINTSKKIIEELKKMRLNPQLLKNNCIVVDINGSELGKTIALRADMDALSIEEENSHDYKSRNQGVMHACGHDGHMAMLLGAAKYFSENKNFKGTVRCLFQPSEETGEGANLMIKQDVLKNVDEIFAIHLWSGIEVGKISIGEGPQTAAVGIFNIEIIGKGGHGSMPHECIDSIVIASNVVCSLQNIVSRFLNPMDVGVISVGEFHSGSRFNIISERAKLSGTTRVYKKDLLESLPKKMEEVIKGISMAYGAKYTFNHKWGIENPTVNNCEIAQTIKKLKVKDAEFIDIGPLPIGEDVGNMMTLVPGVLALVGAGNKEKGIDNPHHHPKFEIDEDSLIIGANLHIEVALNFLSCHL